jgi:hypothetical protein
MNKLHLQSLYFTQNTISDAMVSLSHRNPEFMSVEPIAPDFVLQETLEQGESEFSAGTSLDMTLSIMESLTQCSSFSTVETCKVLYREVFQKRNVHSPFRELGVSEQWYYVEERKQKEVGPLSAEEMDQRFRWGILRERALVRTKNEQDFRMFAALIKQYIKQTLTKRIRLESISLRAASELNKLHQHDDITHETFNEIIERRAREERVLSNIVRPNLAALAACVGGEDDEEETLMTRGRVRASTLQPLTIHF